MPVSLTPRERTHLKARAHELIKVKILGDDRDARAAIGEAICAGTDAAPVQRVGKVIVLWRPKPEPVKERTLAPTR